MTTKIFNKKFSGNAKEASGTAGHGGKHHFRKLCRKKSRSWKSWFEGKELTSTSNNDQYYALLPLDENERSSDLGNKSLIFIPKLRQLQNYLLFDKNSSNITKF